eukprot:TRINITY_DN104431_c0_g1_i1.p1 TRINITY_DN104431_c0_g1~~TRINITY_DN104431_c0_g1_i1.p1  ORF type:complete len:318 (-),score=27.23 TRINITY_DN104431_c0_g1_i1:106-1059(-)
MVNDPATSLLDALNPSRKSGIATMSLFVGIEFSAKELGVEEVRHNAWAFRGTDNDRDFEQFFAQSREQYLGRMRSAQDSNNDTNRSQSGRQSGQSGLGTSTGITDSGDKPVSESRLLLPGVFIGFPSNKDPSFKKDFGEGKTTVTVITFVNWEWFRGHGEEQDNKKNKIHNRSADNDELKERIGREMWRFACEVYPGVTEKTATTTQHIGWWEVGSPLSNNQYIGSAFGEIYGADHNYERFSIARWGGESSVEHIGTGKGMLGIRNLVTAGQDSFCGGFAGAFFGGVLAAGHVLDSHLGMWAGLIWNGFRYCDGFKL